MTKMIDRALKVLPFGGSTYSKTSIAYNWDSPLFISHGDSYRAFTVDGEELTDMVMGLGSVILGHRNPYVDEAIRRQLACGTTFSLASNIEVEAAERLLVHFPEGHMVQWGTNGTDATMGACRLARLVTGRKFIVMARNGYHGFSDWSLAGSKRGYGIPTNTTVGEFKVPEDLYEIDSSNVAAIIIEPDLHPEWLPKLRSWTSKHGALLIADETMTWARYPEWLGSKHYGIEADIICLGKALANGMPCSAIIGHKDIMKRFAPGKETNAFFSSTWAGHPLSMSALIATLDVMEQENGCQKIWDGIKALSEALYPIIVRLNNDDRLVWCEQDKYLPFHRMKFKSPSIGNAWRKLMNKHGVLIYAAHNWSLAHDANAMSRVVRAWERTAEELKDYKDEAELVVNNIMRR